MPENKQSVTLSIIVPVFSGAEHLGELTERIDQLSKKWQKTCPDLILTEAIFVLDEPKDDSKAILEKRNLLFPWIRVVELSRNFGQHSATVAGVLYSSSDWVVTLDEDLQHDPFNIESLLQEQVRSNADIVYAQPNKSSHGVGYRDFSSLLAKSIVSKISGNKLLKSFNSFRLIRGDIARAASSICAQSTYFDVALTWFTKRVCTVDLDLSDLRYIESKKSGYNLWSLIQHGKRLFLTAEFRLLESAFLISALTLVVSVLFAAWIIYGKFFSDSVADVPGWASLMVVVLGFGSLTIFFLGLIAELLHISMLQLQGKPTFFVVNRSSDAELSRILSTSTEFESEYSD